jgi:hypothetical protein
VKNYSFLAIALTVTITAFVTACGTSELSNKSPIHGNEGGGNSGGNAISSDGSSSASFHVDEALTSNWIKAASSKHAVIIQLQTPVNNLSINGYSHGFAKIIIPLNWNVTIHFKNANQVIREGIVVTSHANIAKGTKASPVFTGAATSDYLHGTPPNGTRTFTFTPTKTGNYVIESVQTGQSGTWLWFIVSAAATQPVVETR